MARWQHPYAHVPEDEYLSSQDWLVRTGGAFKLCRQYPQQAPHQMRELNLMLAGLKPLAIVEDSRWRYWQPVVRARGWHALPKHGEHVWQHDWVVALPGQLWRAQRLLSLYAGFAGRMTATDHARVGYLLSYTKADIRAFNQRCFTLA